MFSRGLTADINLNLNSQRVRDFLTEEILEVFLSVPFVASLVEFLLCSWISTFHSRSIQGIVFVARIHIISHISIICACQTIT
jgi:hypothetical protein